MSPLLSASDLSSVPSDFVKYFFISLGFVIVIGLQIYNAAKGRDAQKREVSGHLKTEAVIEFADADELETLRRAVEVDKSAFTARISTLEQSFTVGLGTLGKETLQGLGEIKVMAAGHDATIAQIEKRVTALEQEHLNQMQSLHRRIDDAMKLRTRPAS